ncbi:metallophosphoesterase [Sphingopyxis panaciterrae]
MTRKGLPAIMIFAALALLAGPISPGWSQEVAQGGPSAAGDGPYVTANGRGWTALRITADLQPQSEAIEPEGGVTVAAVGDVPAFFVPLRPTIRKAAADRFRLDRRDRLLVLADTHGEYEILVAFLQRQGAINRNLEWSFGNGTLVVTGDMLDRGTHQLEILWLFYKLQLEAKKAGGALHVLLGNHESMNLRGDRRFLHPRYPQAASILGRPDYGELLAPDSVLGNWLRTRPAVLKLGDMLFLHGGISPAIVDAKLSIPDLNLGIHAAIATAASDNAALGAKTQLIAGPLGPQWYRGYFPEFEPNSSESDVDRSLHAYGVSRIFVGHTVVEKETALYGGKVVAVQVYPHRDETNAPVLEGALRENGRWYRVGATGLREALMLSPNAR